MKFSLLTVLFLASASCSSSTIGAASIEAPADSIRELSTNNKSSIKAPSSTGKSPKSRRELVVEDDTDTTLHELSSTKSSTKAPSAGKSHKSRRELVVEDAADTICELSSTKSSTKARSTGKSPKFESTLHSVCDGT
jgi:hypothetical protein